MVEVSADVFTFETDVSTLVSKALIAAAEADNSACIAVAKSSTDPVAAGMSAFIAEPLSDFIDDEPDMK